MRNPGGSTCLSVGWVAFDGWQRHYPLSQSGRRGNPWSFPPSLSIPDPCIVNFKQAGRQACSQVQDPRSQAALLWVPSLGCGVSRARKPSFPLLPLPLLVPAIAEEPLLTTPVLWGVCNVCRSLVFGKGRCGEVSCLKQAGRSAAAHTWSSCGRGGYRWEAVQEGSAPGYCLLHCVFRASGGDP